MRDLPIGSASSTGDGKQAVAEGLRAGRRAFVGRRRCSVVARSMPGRLLRRLLVVGSVVALVILIAIALLPFLLTSGSRLAIEETPADVGLTFENVAFRPRDLPITLRAWWMPVDRPKAAIVMVHGGGEDNRSIPF